jgi:hypothetical protein
MVKAPPATAKPTASAAAAAAPQVSAVKGVSPGAALRQQEARLKNILQRQDQVLQQAQQKAQELEQKIRIMQLAKAAEASAAAIAARTSRWPVRLCRVRSQPCSHRLLRQPSLHSSAPHAEASKAVTPAKPVVSKAPEAEKAPASWWMMCWLSCAIAPCCWRRCGDRFVGLLLAQRRRRARLLAGKQAC